MAYNPINWVNGSTPINATNLNHMDDQIRINEANISSMNSDIKEIGHLANRIASVNDVGLVKPDGITTRTSADGTITAIGGGEVTRPASAIEVSYNDGATHLGANNVQNAIENVTAKLSENADWLKNKNIYDKNTLISGIWMDNKGEIHSIGSSNEWSVTDYISINGGQTYSFAEYRQNDNASFVWYDANKNYISGQAFSTTPFITVVAPSNAKYLRASVTVFDYDSFQILEGKYSKSNVEIAEELANLPIDYKYAGFARNTESITLPNKWKVANVYIKANNNSSLVFAFTIIHGAVEQGLSMFRNGFYSADDNNALATVKVTDGDVFTMPYVLIDKNDVKSNSLMYIYYK